MDVANLAKTIKARVAEGTDETQRLTLSKTEKAVKAQLELGLRSVGPADVESGALFAVKAWLFAFERGFTEYRATLDRLGIARNGNFQRCWYVARVAHLSGEEPGALLADAGSLRKADEQAREVLRAGGLMKATSKKDRTHYERAESFIGRVLNMLGKAEKGKAKSGKAGYIPAFNAREALAHALAKAGVEPHLIRFLETEEPRPEPTPDPSPSPEPATVTT